MIQLSGHSNLLLCSRNEGKIKSFESCRDVRAWSHDVRVRDRYLREWIKCDMPICVLPTGILARFMRAMTSRSRGRATPRCHPDCKSKLVLDTICNSSLAMKNCLKNETRFEKYFNDEEFETSHWPCERCLEALKSFKMFWKVITEKIFNITVPKNDDLDQKRCCRTDSVRSVAKLWQSEMTQQAMYVKNISFMNRSSDFLSPCNGEEKTVKKETAACTPCGVQDLKSNDINKRAGKADCKTGHIIKSYRVKSTDTDCLSNPLVNRSNKTGSSLNSRRHGCRTPKPKMVDIGCDCNEVTEEVNAQKSLLLHLQDKCNCQKQEIDKLRKENSSLRIELQNIYKNSSWKSAFFTPSRCSSNHDSIATRTLPNPFECCAAHSVDTTQVKGVESEMIITMKNGKNEDYGHISLLQVLHKTNCPDIKELKLGQACSNQKEDPVELLTKVQNTFGAIVEREMGIMNNKRECERKCDIDATFNKVNACKSAPICSRTTLASSESRFIKF